MLSIVQSYLSKHFELKTSDVGNDGIYFLCDIRIDKAPFYHTKLIKEISTIFGLPEDETITYINAWAHSINKKVNLEFYWKSNLDIFSPFDSRPRVNKTKPSGGITQYPRVLFIQQNNIIEEE